MLVASSIQPPASHSLNAADSNMIGAHGENTGRITGDLSAQTYQEPSGSRPRNAIARSRLEPGSFR